MGNNTKVLVIYHNADYDGECSAAIVRYKIPHCDLLGLNHGDIYDMDMISSYDEVFVCDFSLPIDDMVKLNKLTRLYYCDHHITSIQAIENSGERFSGNYHTEQSGCELTWDFLFPDIEMPHAVWLLGRWDIWAHHESLDIKPFQLGIGINDTHPNNKEFWESLFESFIDGDYINRIIRDGNTIQTFVTNQNEDKMKSSFVTEIDGLSVLALNNAPPGSSIIFDSEWDESLYDIMIHFCRVKGKWNISFYTTKDDIDVGSLAKMLSMDANDGGSGGGHHNAAGMTTKTLPFDI